MRIYFILLLVCCTNILYAQCILNVSGYVHDATTKLHLKNASIQIQELNKQTLTNDAGYFYLDSICSGIYTIKVLHDSCNAIIQHVHIRSNTVLDFDLPHYENTVTVYSQQQIKNVIKGNTLDQTRGLSLAEAAQQITGVNMLQTGANIYKPIVHGLHSSRLLIVNNNVRQEAQQWGSEHAPEIDPFVAQRIEVIKGANTLRYGADAIAGVIVVDPDAIRKDSAIGGTIFLAGFSNNRSGVVSGTLEGNVKKIPALSWRLQGTYKKAGNAKTPDYWLSNSGVRENNFSTTATYQKNKWFASIFYSQFNTRIGIFTGSHIGNVTDLWNSILAAKPPDYIIDDGFTYNIDRPYQTVTHQLLKANMIKRVGNNNKLHVTLSKQINNRNEYDQKRFASSSNFPQLWLQINSYIADVAFEYSSKKIPLKGSVGAQFLQQDNRYQSRLFIPNYNLYNIGVFAIQKYKIKRVSLEAGLRQDAKSIYNINDNTNLKQFSNRSFQNFSGHIGASIHISNNATLLINYANAWRAPNINELYASGLHHGAARIENGDPLLKAEKANSIQTQFLLNTNVINIDVNAYYKNISGFIYLEPRFPPELTIRGAFPSFGYTQTNAILKGIDASITYSPNTHIDLNAKASVLHAFNKVTKQFIIQMPANKTDVTATYYVRNTNKINNSYISLQGMHVFEQTRVPTTGNIEIPNSTQKQADYIAPPPAYTLCNIVLGTQYKIQQQQWHIIFSIQNVFNKQYREYMNAFRYFSDEMGRNISLRLKIPFDFTHKHK
jgi:iron complex outermembrane recepter protein